MSIQTIPTFALPILPEQIAAAPTHTGGATADITAVGGSVAYIYQIPSTGYIDTIFFRLFTSTTCTVRAAIKSVNLITGIPDNNLLYTGASGSVSVTTAGSYTVSFASPVQVIRGDLFALEMTVIAGTSPNITFFTFTDDNQGNGFPYIVDLSTGSGPLIRDDMAIAFGMGLNGVSAMPLPFCWPNNANSGTISFKSPNAYGNRITVNYPVRVCGATIWGNVETAPATVVLYDGDGTTLLTSTNWNYNLPPNTTSNKFSVLFPTGVELLPGSYYLAVSGSNPGGSNHVTMYESNFESFWRGASPMGGTDVVYVSSAGAGWTQVNTKQVYMGFLVDGIDDGTGNGGGGGETSSVFFA